MGDQRPFGWRDVLLPGVIAVAGVAELAAMRTGPWVLAAVLEVVGCTLMVWRRQAPVVMSVLAMAAIWVIPWLGGRLDDASVPIALVILASYSLGRYAQPLRRGLVGVGLVAVGIGASYAVADPRTHSWSDVVFLGALFLPPFVLGRLVSRMAQQKQLLVEQQRWIEQEAAKGERVRIARELHDVIAHSVSAMVVQSAVARDRVQTDPDGAVAALDTVMETGRAALAETGRVLRVLRDEGDEQLGLPPAPGLARLSELLDGFRNQGLALHSHIDTGGEPLPAAVDVTAYRVVQEALTNALRHGSSRSATLLVSRADDTLTLSVTNSAGSGAGTASQWAGSGLGLAGIRERVTLCGGQLHHGRVAGGQYELTATLPVDPAAVPSRAGLPS